MVKLPGLPLEDIGWLKTIVNGLRQGRARKVKKVLAISF